MMSTSRSGKGSVSGPGSPSEAPSSSRRYLRFLVTFCGLTALFYVVFLSGPFQQRVFVPYLRWAAQCTAWMASILGAEATAGGEVVTSGGNAIAIRHGCDALEPIGLFLAALWGTRARVLSLCLYSVVGFVVLLCLNLVRTTSLLLMAVHWPDGFDVAHEVFWQPVFLLSTICLWYWVVEYRLHVRGV